MSRVLSWMAAKKRKISLTNKASSNQKTALIARFFLPITLVKAMSRFAIWCCSWVPLKKLSSSIGRGAFVWATLAVSRRGNTLYINLDVVDKAGIAELGSGKNGNVLITCSRCG